MYLFHTVTGDKIFHLLCCWFFLWCKTDEIEYKIVSCTSHGGRYIWSSLPFNVFVFSYSFFLFFLSLRVNLQCSFPNRHAPFLTKIMFIIFTTSWYHIKGELHPQPKISMFSALSQNYQHLLSDLPKELKNGIEILVGQMVFKLWIKTVKILLW